MSSNCKVSVPFAIESISGGRAAFWLQGAQRAQLFVQSTGRSYLCAIEVPGSRWPRTIVSYVRDGLFIGYLQDAEVCFAELKGEIGSRSFQCWVVLTPSSGYDSVWSAVEDPTETA